MRNYIGEIYSAQEVQEYVESIKDLSIDGLFALFVANNKETIHYDDNVYQLWQENYEIFKSNPFDPRIDKDFYTRKNLMCAAVADKFYLLCDDPVLEKIVYQYTQEK